MEKFRGVERMVVREKLPGLGTDTEAKRLKSHESWCRYRYCARVRVL